MLLFSLNNTNIQKEDSCSSKNSSNSSIHRKLPVLTIMSSIFILQSTKYHIYLFINLSIFIITTNIIFDDLDMVTGTVSVILYKCLCM